MGDAASLTPGYGALATLVVFIVASVWLGTIAQRVVQRGDFLKGYFLGNRSLGSWALALTATVQSGGTFMGFPSLVYSHGWIVALWIASYMVVPISGFGVIGKRVAQLSRRTGAITLPDLFRERFDSRALGLISSLFVMFFMSSMMVAQFKAGALIMKIAWPGTGVLALSEDAEGGIDRAYYVGLAVFTLTVVGYTLIGGFLAAVWTDLFQSVMMFIGVVALLLLALTAAGGLANATQNSVAATGPEFALGPGYSKDGRVFLPLGLAFSFFVIWPFTGFSSPASVVRVMACRDTGTIRRSLVLLSVYNLWIYLPLIVICVCARSLMPNLEKSDEVIPRMALLTTSHLRGGSLLAGLILAAPFGAVLATVSSYLVVIASGLVRDIYQRFLRPHATTREMRLLSYAVMIIVGTIALLANIWPVQYLQAIVVFSGTGAATTFFVPLMMTAYWRRATRPGVLAAMFVGSGTTLSLYAVGTGLAWLRKLEASGSGTSWSRSVVEWFGPESPIGQMTQFRPYYLYDCDPIVWAFLASAMAGVAVSLLTRPPQAELVERLFGPQPESAS